MAKMFPLILVDLLIMYLFQNLHASRREAHVGSKYAFQRINAVNIISIFEKKNITICLVKKKNIKLAELSVAKAPRKKVLDYFAARRAQFY